MSFKKWAFYPLMIVVFATIFLFFEFIVGFKSLYIDQLKGVYPNIFLVTNGVKVKPPVPGFVHDMEAFDVSRDFRFRFAPSAPDVVFADVGLRAANPSRLRKSLHVHLGKREVFLSPGLYRKIASSPEFNGHSIFIENYRHETLKIFVEKFALHGNKEWTIFPEKLAKRIGIINNIEAIYSKSQFSNDEIKEIYKKHGLSPISWSDRIPFLTSVIYKTLKHVYFIICISVVILVMFLGLGIIVDTLSEFDKLIKLSVFYGVKEIYVQVSFLLLSFVNFSIFWFVSYSLKEFAKARIEQALNWPPGLMGISAAPEFFLFFLGIVLSVMAFMVRRRYRRSGFLVGQ